MKKKYIIWMLLTLLLSGLVFATNYYVPSENDDCSRVLVINQSSARNISKSQYVIEVNGVTERYGNYTSYNNRMSALNGVSYTNYTDNYTRTVYDRYEACPYEQFNGEIRAERVVAEVYLTASRLPDPNVDYLSYFYMVDLQQKTTHYAKIDEDKLNLEQRVEALEGAMSQVLRELCLVDSDNRFCNAKRIEEVKDSVNPYVQPTGAHDAYAKGDYVLWDDKIYRSLIDANVWSPLAYPAGWEENQ